MDFQPRLAVCIHAVASIRSESAMKKESVGGGGRGGGGVLVLFPPPSRPAVFAAE